MKIYWSFPVVLPLLFQRCYLTPECKIKSAISSRKGYHCGHLKSKWNFVCWKVCLLLCQICNEKLIRCLEYNWFYLSWFATFNVFIWENCNNSLNLSEAALCCNTLHSSGTNEKSAEVISSFSFHEPRLFPKDISA